MKAEELEQPRDPSHPIYAILAKYIVVNDAKKIADDLGVNPSLVSNVKAGRTISKTVWPHLVRIAIKRKNSETEFLQYMNK